MDIRRGSLVEATFGQRRLYQATSRHLFHSFFFLRSSLSHDISEANQEEHTIDYARTRLCQNALSIPGIVGQAPQEHKPKDSCSYDCRPQDMPQDYEQQDYQPTARASATKRQDVEPPIGSYGQKVSKARNIDTGTLLTWRSAQNVRLAG